MTVPGSSERVIIVGGGIGGLSAAARLSQAGLPVILLEAAALGFHASTRNQGWLHSGALFAVNDPQLAQMCLKSLKETVAFCPHCIEPDHDGMLYVASRIDTPTSRWTEAWKAVGISFEEVGRDRFSQAVPGAQDELVRRVFLLPDRAFRPDVLLEEFAAMARNAGAEIRSETTVVKVLLRNGEARGVLTGAGEEIAGGQILLATGGMSERDLATNDEQPRPGQPVCQRVALKAHLVSLRPDLSHMPFVFIDWHDFNHIPHSQTSVFHSGRWKITHDPHDSHPDPEEISALWADIQTLFPGLDRSRIAASREWAGSTVQALGVDQVQPGAAPRPIIIDHAEEGGPKNLWSLYPGRASLWPQLVDQLRERILSRLQRVPLSSASPPWSR